MPMTVRNVQPEDEAAIAELLSQLGYPASTLQVRARLDHLKNCVTSIALVAVEAERVVGFACLEFGYSIAHDHPVGRIAALVVDEQVRNRGYGTSLLAASERMLIERGVERIVLTSANHREDAHRFYERHGYLGTGRRFVKQTERGS